jgi:hypothetical protein
MFVAIILIVLVIFSISIVSGADDFAFSPDPTGKPSPSISPTATPSAGTITPPPANTAGWSLSYNPEGCIQEVVPYQKGRLVANGLTSGYITIETINGTSSNTILSSQFSPSQVTYILSLSNSDGFNSSPWRINIYEGGIGSGGNYTGGTKQADFNTNPTGC